MATTPKGVPYPVGTDLVVDGDDAIQALAEWVDARPGIATLTTAERDALAGAGLWTGRKIYNTTTGRDEHYNGAAWVPNPSPPELRILHAFTGPNEFTISTAFTDLTTVGPTVTFNAPVSGRALLLYGCVAWHPTGGSEGSEYAPEVVRTSDSSVHTAPTADLNDAKTRLTNPMSIASSLLLTGLVAGAEYRARMKYRSTTGAAAAAFWLRRLTVMPSA